jgi:methionyl-tRNA formyltransferase
MINKFLIKLPNPKKQVGKPVVFKRRKPEQSNIFNLDRISDIYNHIRMLDIDNKNFPKAFIKTKNFIYILSKAKFRKKNLVCQALIKKIN